MGGMARVRVANVRTSSSTVYTLSLLLVIKMFSFLSCVKNSKVSSFILCVEKNKYY